MRRTLQALRGLEREVQQIRQELSEDAEISGRRQVELLHDAIYGDANAAEKFESLHAEGKILPFLWNLYQLEQGVGR